MVYSGRKQRVGAHVSSNIYDEALVLLFFNDFWERASKRLEDG